MNFKKLFTVATLAITGTAFAQEGVSIKQTLGPPHASAMLDIESANKGLLIPRIALTNVTTAAPVTSPTNGLMVYNTNASMTGGFGAGFYYWEGSKWNKVASGISSLWNKIGTSNDIRYDGGKVQIGLSTSLAPTYELEVARTSFYTFKLGGYHGELRCGTIDAGAFAGGGSFLTQTATHGPDNQDYAAVFTHVLEDNTKGFQVTSYGNTTAHTAYTTVTSDASMYIGNSVSKSIIFVAGGSTDANPSGFVRGNLTGSTDTRQWDLFGLTTVHGNLNVTGTSCSNGGSFSCSDIRYKTNISPLTGSLSKVMKMKGVSYDWKVNEFPDKKFSDKKQLGVIAQELETLYPELVYTDEKGFKSVDYARLAPILIEAIKEQQAQIQSLEQRMKTIEGTK